MIHRKIIYEFSRYNSANDGKKSNETNLNLREEK